MLPMKNLRHLLLPLLVLPVLGIAQELPPKLLSMTFEEAEIALDFTDPNLGGARYSIERSPDLTGWVEDEDAVVGDSFTILGMRASVVGAGVKSEFFRVNREAVPVVLGFAPID